MPERGVSAVLTRRPTSSSLKSIQTPMGVRSPTSSRPASCCRSMTGQGEALLEGAGLDEVAIGVSCGRREAGVELGAVLGGAAQQAVEHELGVEAVAALRVGEQVFGDAGFEATAPGSEGMHHMWAKNICSALA